MEKGCSSGPLARKFIYPRVIVNRYGGAARAATPKSPGYEADGLGVEFGRRDAVAFGTEGVKSAPFYICSTRQYVPLLVSEPALCAHMIVKSHRRPRH
jgi:hypothetical protein